jgi:hypothetical protein
MVDNATYRGVRKILGEDYNVWETLDVDLPML